MVQLGFGRFARLHAPPCEHTKAGRFRGMTDMPTTAPTQTKVKSPLPHFIVRFNSGFNFGSDFSFSAIFISPKRLV
jgi:hypothetical protein